MMLQVSAGNILLLRQYAKASARTTYLEHVQNILTTEYNRGARTNSHPRFG